ncbi:unnamed protein product [Trichogramma brassicae]|uniref:Uncharacterized protein n=1 Tax=Trichogramma brassicae TaxID=86971 RepID=A0A6H5HUG2_9HYME|nr:unnamed protein product [Trichogramma brassicae]
MTDDSDDSCLLRRVSLSPGDDDVSATDSLFFEFVSYFRVRLGVVCRRHVEHRRPHDAVLSELASHYATLPRQGLRRHAVSDRVAFDRRLASSKTKVISVVRYRGSNTSQISARVLLASSRQVGAGLAGTGRTDVNTAMFTSAHHSGISRPASPLLRCRCVVAPHGADYLKNTARVFVIIHELYIFAPHSRHGDVCRGHNVTKLQSTCLSASASPRPLITRTLGLFCFSRHRPVYYFSYTVARK